ncbi:Integrator complex subunit 12, variant 2 [Orbilia oligospora]|nr:Integrator complex subunit 12, variant 2 [Orbilia oligospora]
MLCCVATVPVRKKRKRRKSKTSHRRYDSSTSSEEYIQSGFKTLSGRTVINPNTRKEPSLSPSPLPLPPINHHTPQKSKSKPKFKSKKMSRTSFTSSKSATVGRKLAVNQVELEAAMRLSILNARCVNCHKASDSKGDKIVFCDGCERPYHQKCHRPIIDQSYIEVLEKNWFCFECATVPGEGDDLSEEMGYYEEGEEANRRNELINQIQAEQNDDKAYLRDVDATSEERGDEDQQKEENGNDHHHTEKREQNESQPTMASGNETTIAPTNTIKNLGTMGSQNMEAAIKELDDDQHKLFLKTLTHDHLVDLICHLRLKGATFDFDFPSGIKDKLAEFTRAQIKKDKGTKRKALADEVPNERESGPVDEPVPSLEGEDEGSDGGRSPESKRRKLTASQRYWLWREDPETPSITHIVYRDGVGRPAHEVYPPLFPYPGRGQSGVSQTEGWDGGGEDPKDSKRA